MIDYTTDGEQIIIYYKLLFQNLRSCNHLINLVMISGPSDWLSLLRLFRLRKSEPEEKKAQYATQSRMRNATGAVP